MSGDELLQVRPYQLDGIYVCMVWWQTQSLMSITLKNPVDVISWSWFMLLLDFL